MRCNRCKLNHICRQLRRNTKEHFKWSIHNLFAHPLSEIAYLLRMEKLSNWLHDSSVPEHLPGTGRG